MGEEKRKKENVESVLQGDDTFNLHMLSMHCKSCLYYAAIIFYANCLSAATVSYTYL